MDKNLILIISAAWGIVVLVAIYALNKRFGKRIAEQYDESREPKWYRLVARLGAVLVIVIGGKLFYDFYTGSVTPAEEMVTSKILYLIVGGLFLLSLYILKRNKKIN